MEDLDKFMLEMIMTTELLGFGMPIGFLMSKGAFRPIGGNCSDQQTQKKGTKNASFRHL